MRSMRTAKFSNTPFEGLKTTLEKRRFILRERKVRDARSDEEIFREAMSDVREIPEFRKMFPGQTLKVRTFPCQKDNSLDVLNRLVKGEARMRLSDTPEYISWARPHMRRDIIDKLHRGDYSVQDTIDLHGLTLAEAEESLSCFFRQAIQKRLFCIKVIHGRGLRSPQGPVLKEALKRFLHRSFSKWILAYATAKQCDGGLGATYIILKSR
jgi:DNA-nicking Smr family endonuclease